MLTAKYQYANQSFKNGARDIIETYSLTKLSNLNSFNDFVAPVYEIRATH